MDLSELGSQVKQLGSNVEALSQTVKDTRKEYVPLQVRCDSRCACCFTMTLNSIFSSLNLQEFNKFCEDVLQKLGQLKATCEEAIEAKKALDALAAAQAAQPAAAQPATAQAEAVDPSLDDSPVPEREVNAAELKLGAYFPINSYTKDVKWLLEQPIVQEYLEHKVMAELYKGYPKVKASPEDTVYAFMDEVFTERFQCHCGMPNSNVSNYQFGRFPFPSLVFDIFQRRIMKLGRPTAEGARSHADIIKDKCYTDHRMKITTGSYVKSAESLEEMAFRLYWERIQFYENGHQVIDANSSVSSTCSM